jgi:hypothetical protein
MIDSGYNVIVFHCARNGIPQLLNGFHSGTVPSQNAARWYEAHEYPKIEKSRKKNVRDPEITSGNIAQIKIASPSANFRAVSQSSAKKDDAPAFESSIIARNFSRARKPTKKKV